MIDITKEELLNSSYIEIEKVNSKEKTAGKFTNKNKLMAVAISFYIALTIANMFLCYYFFKLFSKL